MKHIYCFLLLFLCSATMLLAQSNYKPGYIVKITGDTTRGLINYRESDLSPKQISFKITEGDRASTLTVAGISAFGVANAEYYERHTLQISQDEVNSTAVGNKRVDTSSKTEVVFAKVIAKGKNLDIYSYADEIKTRFYFRAAANNNLQELGYHIKPLLAQGSSGDGNYIYATTEEYKQQLSAIAEMANVLNKGLTFKIEHSGYNERDLISIAGKINGSSSTFTAQSLIGTRLFIGAGINAGRFAFGGEGTFPADLNIKNTVPAVTAGIDIFLNRHTQQFYFRVQLDYASHQYGYQNLPSKTNANVLTSFNFKQSTSSIALLPTYNFYNTSSLKVFLNAGGGLSLSSYNKYQYIENFYNTSQRVQDNYPEFTKLWFGAQANVGVEVSGRFIIHAGGSTYNRITKYTGITASVASYHAGVIYIFGKL